MTKKKASNNGETEVKATVSPTVETASENEAVENNELVNEAGIDITVNPDNTQNDEADNVKAAPATEDELTKLPSEMRGEAPETVTPEPVKKEVPAQNIQSASSTTLVLNTSQNNILLTGGTPEESVLIAPKELKSIKRELLRKLLRNKVVRYWFDKGILTSNEDANEVSAHDAVAPEYLKNPVERHDGANVSASVTKFEKQGSVTINLS